MQLSTVISDFVLASVTLFIASRVQHKPTASIGLFIVGVASSFGVLRFGGASQLVPLHDFLSNVGGNTGYPLVMLAFVIGRGGLIRKDALTSSKKAFSDVKRGNPYDKLSLVITAVLLAGSIASQMLLPSTFHELYTMTVAVPCATAALVAVVKRRNWLAIAGIALFMGVGTFGIKGSIGPVLKVDIFHYGLTVAHILFWKALSQ